MLWTSCILVANITFPYFLHIFPGDSKLTREAVTKDNAERTVYARRIFEKKGTHQRRDPMVYIHATHDPSLLDDLENKLSDEGAETRDNLLCG